MGVYTSQLLALRDDGNRDFVAKLLPNVDKQKILGIRTPAMRAFSKTHLRDADKEVFYTELPHTYLEENTLHGTFISAEKDVDKAFALLDSFLPYVDNWATCDSISVKAFKKEPQKVFAKTAEWAVSDDEYARRFALDVLLQFFLDDDFSPEVLALAASVKGDEYYVKMAKAWFFSFALIKQYASTIGYFTSPTLDAWTHNKSLQKARESYRVPDDVKAYLSTLKIK